MPTLVWCFSLMTTTIMWSLLTWWWPLQWSQHDAARLMLVHDVHGSLESWWWSHVFDDCWWCSPWRWLWAITLYCGTHGPVDALAWSFDDGDGGALLMWWSPCTWWWPWGHVGVDMLCLDDMMYIDGDDLALITWFDHMMEMALLCSLDRDDMMAWHTWWRFDLACDEDTLNLTLPFIHLTYLALALPILANPCKTLIHPS